MFSISALEQIMISDGSIKQDNNLCPRTGFYSFNIPSKGRKYFISFIDFLFLIEIYFQLRNKWIQKRQEHDEGHQKPQVARPPIQYTIEQFGEEGDRRNYSIPTEMHDDQYCIAYKFLEASET